MVPSFQNSHLLRHSKGEKNETDRLDQTKCFSHLHNLVQIGHPGSSKFSKEKVEIFNIGRSTEHKKFQIAEMAVTIKFSNTTVSSYSKKKYIEFDYCI